MPQRKWLRIELEDGVMNRNGRLDYKANFLDCLMAAEAVRDWIDRLDGEEKTILPSLLNERSIVEVARQHGMSLRTAQRRRAALIAKAAQDLAEFRP